MGGRDVERESKERQREESEMVRLQNRASRATDREKGRSREEQIERGERYLCSERKRGRGID